MAPEINGKQGPKTAAVYRWGQVAEERVNPQAGRRMIHGQTMSLIRRRFRKGATTMLHRHAEEQICLVERGKLLYAVDGQQFTVVRGDLLVIPPDVEHSLEALANSIVVDLFATPPQRASPPS